MSNSSLESVHRGEKDDIKDDEGNFNRGHIQTARRDEGRRQMCDSERGSLEKRAHGRECQTSHASQVAASTVRDIDGFDTST